MHPRAVRAWCRYQAVTAAGTKPRGSCWPCCKRWREAHCEQAECRSCELLVLQARASAQADVDEGGAAPLPLQSAFGARWLLLRACALRTAWAAEAAAAPAGSPDVAAKATAVDVAHELQTSNLARTRGGTQPGWV